MRTTTLLSTLSLLLLSPFAVAQQQQPIAEAPTEKTHKLSLYTSPLHPGPQHSRYEKYTKITYTYPSLNHSLDAITPPSFLDPTTPLAADEIVRFGYYAGRIGDEETWHGVATSAGAFAADKVQKVKLYLDGEGKVWHVGFSSEPNPSQEVLRKGKQATEKKEEQEGSLVVELVRQNKGPRMQLNKPIVVNKDGKKEGEGAEENKSFLQKYWWAIALFLVVQVVMGGGGEK